ncbi:unnamed protein product [Prunus armeniaca]|uniref:Uncharacterized protein n=1 Tax=Prunus armeniaca TaxID=36596 RepID=A0A6J5XW61_PRUAR|nr:unnamed protein product [Prunus armeniaca]
MPFCSHDVTVDLGRSAWSGQCISTPTLSMWLPLIRLALRPINSTWGGQYSQVGTLAPRPWPCGVF